MSIYFCIYFQIGCKDHMSTNCIVIMDFHNVKLQVSDFKNLNLEYYSNFCSWAYQTIFLTYIVLYVVGFAASVTFGTATGPLADK